MSELDQPLKGFRVLVCVSGSISAYKSAYLVRSLKKLGAFVSVALTPATTRFVGSVTYSALASEPAFDDLWDNRGSIAHTTLGKASDLVVVCPATASTIAKMANGFADDIVSATLLCTPKETPILVVPAMHEEMYENRATQDNIAILEKRLIEIIGPDSGDLAGGDTGRGRLVEPEQIVKRILEKLKSAKPKKFQTSKITSQTDNGDNRENRKPTVLITAGGTREPIDTVRVISNRSSGKMGHALANAAKASGYNVILITSSELLSTDGVERFQVETSDEMYDQVVKNLDRADIVVMAAAVSDYKPLEISANKLKRNDGLKSISLIETTDILEAVVAKKNSSTFVVGFAAESENVLENATKKYEDKGVDMLVVNDISNPESKFGSENNKVWILDGSDSSPNELDSLPKQALAFEIIELVEQKRTTSKS